MKKILFLTVLALAGQMYASSDDKIKEQIQELITQIDNAPMPARKEAWNRLSQIAQAEYKRTRIYPNIRFENIFPYKMKSSQFVAEKEKTKSIGKFINSSSLSTTDKIKQLKKTLDKGDKKWINVINLELIGDMTPLQFAVLRGEKDLIDVLLQYGADINAVDNANETPLHTAALTGNKEIAELLLKRGADTLIRSNFRAVTDEHINKTAAEYARLSGSDDIAKMINEWTYKKYEQELTPMLKPHLPGGRPAQTVIEYLAGPSKGTIKEEESEKKATQQTDEEKLKQKVRDAYNSGNQGALKAILNKIASDKQQINIIQKLYRDELQYNDDKTAAAMNKILYENRIDTTKGIDTETSMPEVD